MRSSIRSRLAAAVVFALIAVVMVGGMGWATASSVELARQNIVKERERRQRERDDSISNALWRMDAHMSGILYAETRRSYEDYKAVVTKQPVAVFARRGLEMDADYVTVPSDLVQSGPPEEWIDLYFQLNPTGDPYLYSAQIADDAIEWAIEQGAPHPGELWPRARQTFEMLRAALPALDIRRSVAEVLAGHRAPSAANETDETARVAATATALGARSDINRDYQRRKRSLRDSQLTYLPQPACVDAQLAEINVHRVAAPIVDTLSGTTTQTGEGGVEITMDPFVAFWMGSASEDDLKLLFVRECHADVDLFYQGFVGDWSLLKPGLLAAAGPLPAGWDLEPVLDEIEASSESMRLQMSNLPVRLSVPPLPPGPTMAAAWQDIGGTLAASWAAALAVLVVAGVGLKNLVALTERRMQFAYAVTHELRTPLTTFRLYTDMMSAGLVPEHKKQDYLDTLNREAMRLSSLVEDVLEYARLESNKVRLNPTETDGESLLATVRETLAQSCAAQGIDARTENAMNNGRQLRTDVDVVNRIAGVLVNNACRHARKRDGAAVCVRVGDDNGQIYLDVIDTGPGIDRGDTRNIFKPFRRGRGADAAAQGGIGLGLALARSWAELLGGHLELVHRKHPEYGGAHFRLTLPPEPKA